MGDASKKIFRLRRALSHQEPDRVPAGEAFWTGFLRRCRARRGESFDPCRHFDLEKMGTHNYFPCIPRRDIRIPSPSGNRNMGIEIAVAALCLICLLPSRGGGEEVLVRLKPGRESPGARGQVFSRGVVIQREYPVLSARRGRTYLLLRAEGLPEGALADMLRTDSRVDAVAPNYRRRLHATIPDDPSFGSLWGLLNSGRPDCDIDATAAWDTTTGDPGVVVAIIDTGVDYNHPDLAANMWINPLEIPGDGLDNDGNGYVDDVYGYDFAGDSSGAGDNNPMDINSHGTHVAGTVAAVGNNGFGITGVTWNSRIMALKAARPDNLLYDSDVVEAIEYAVNMKENFGVRVVAINFSAGGDGYSQILEDAIRMANDAGIVFCTSAGNASRDTDIAPHYPACFRLPGLISTAASDSWDNLAGFSNYGAVSVDLAAPGASVYSTLPLTHATLTAEVVQDSTHYGANALTYSGVTPASGQSGILHYCGLGNPGEFPAQVAGNIALIRRGTLTFAQKVTNAQNAGALAAVIFNNQPGGFTGTLAERKEWIPAIAISQEDGETLLAMGIPTVTTYTLPVLGTAFGNKDGTSMAAPHVSGTVALLAARYPDDGLLKRVSRIFSGVDKRGSLQGRMQTGGRLNAARSLDPGLVLSPLVDEITPETAVAYPGTKMRITGIEFGQSGSVLLETGTGQSQLLVSSWTDTAIEGTVPDVSFTCLQVRRCDGALSDRREVPARLSLSLPFDSESSTVNYGPPDRITFWGNLFSPRPEQLPLEIRTVEVFHKRPAGDDLDIILVEDPDGDGDPSNGTVRATERHRTYAGGECNIFVLKSPVRFTGPGDILVAVKNWSIWPADTLVYTAMPAHRSYTGKYVSSTAMRWSSLDSQGIIGNFGIGVGGYTFLNKGDLDADRQVDVSDVMLLLRVLVDSEPAWLTLADMDGNGVVDIADLVLLLRKALALP